ARPGARRAWLYPCRLPGRPWPRGPRVLADPRLRPRLGRRQRERLLRRPAGTRCERGDAALFLSARPGSRLGDAPLGEQAMNVLVILGHPRVDSFCGALAEAFCEGA